MSFKGCKTRAEARARLTALLEEIHEASIRRMQTDLLIDASQGIVDVDHVDVQIAAARQYFEDSVGDTIAAFNQVLDREGIGSD
jgi:hypothetical protein